MSIPDSLYAFLASDDPQDRAAGLHALATIIGDQATEMNRLRYELRTAAQSIGKLKGSPKQLVIESNLRTAELEGSNGLALAKVSRNLNALDNFG